MTELTWKHTHECLRAQVHIQYVPRHAHTYTCRYANTHRHTCITRHFSSHPVDCVWRRDPLFSAETWLGGMLAFYLPTEPICSSPPAFIRRVCVMWWSIMKSNKREKRNVEKMKNMVQSTGGFLLVISLHLPNIVEMRREWEREGVQLLFATHLGTSKDTQMFDAAVGAHTHTHTRTHCRVQLCDRCGGNINYLTPLPHLTLFIWLCRLQFNCFILPSHSSSVGGSVETE